MQGLSRFEPRRGRSARLALGALLAVVGIVLAARPADAATAPVATSTACPSFRVLHEDRVGAAVFPAGDYTIDLEDPSLDCTTGGELFARFLENFDGTLPAPWTVSAEGPGQATFRRTSRTGFSVELTKPKEEGGTNTDIGVLCPRPVTVTTTTVIRPLRFTKGKFLIDLPPGTAITCGQAAALFQRFLEAGGTLPSPWKLTGETATFYKPAAPIRSAFRIEVLKGTGRS